jgi:hypothetical protein
MSASTARDLEELGDAWDSLKAKTLAYGATGLIGLRDALDPTGAQVRRVTRDLEDQRDILAQAQARVPPLAIAQSGLTDVFANMDSVLAQLDAEYQNNVRAMGASSAAAVALQGPLETTTSKWELFGDQITDLIPAQQAVIGSGEEIRNVLVGLTEDGLIPAETLLEELNAQWAEMPAAVEGAGEAVRTQLASLKGPLSGFFDGVQTSAKGLVEGLTGGEGLSGFFSGIGSGMVESLGGILTGGLTSLINMGVGIVWEGLKKIGGFFKDLFGGPSAEELAGREVVANFEANLATMLTDAQKIEAGNE